MPEEHEDGLAVTLTKQQLRKLVHEELSAVLSEQRQQKDPLIYDTEQAAALLSVKPSWLATRVRKGQVPFKRLGHFIRFSAQDLERIVASGVLPDDKKED